MITIKETQQQIKKDRENWFIWLMDFVDDFRYSKDPSLIKEPIDRGDEKMDALIASTVAALCDELKIEIPQWIHDIPSSKEPWFVSGLENLKAISLVESPLQFRLRKIFVLENFLSRV